MGRMADAPLLELARRRDELWIEPRAVRRLARGRAGRNGFADGPQRHGQDHDSPLHHGADAGGGRLDPLRRRSRSAAAGLPHRQARHRAWCRKGARFFPISPSRENLVATASNRGGAAEPGRSNAVLALFPRLAERASSMANLLSGGEQQMLAIGRALMTNPRLLDPRRSDRRPGAADPRRDLALSRAAARSRPVDPADRQERRALTRIADRHYLIERGRIVWSGSLARSGELARHSASLSRCLNRSENARSRISEARVARENGLAALI